jgi:hypothetical protein
VQKLFPITIIALQVGAVIAYACKGDVRHLVYWLAAAICNVAVTF